MNKDERIKKELEYRDTNNNPESLCDGMFYIANRKEYEKCKHCDECERYKKFKNSGNKESDVKFHYVATFRECEIYKTRTAKKKDTRNFDEVWNRIKKDNPMMFPKDSTSCKPNVISIPIAGSYEVKRAAYEDMVNNHSEIMSYVTWTQLLAIEVLNRSYKMMNDVIRESPMYYGDIEKCYRNLSFKFSKYIEKIHKKCYVGDESVVEEFSERFDHDIYIMRMSISNFLGRYSEIFTRDELSLIITFQNLVELVDLRMKDNNKYISKYNGNVKYDRFISVEPLKEPIKSLILAISNFMGIKSKVDLNKCTDIVNSIIIIDNKIGNFDSFKELITNVYLYNKNNRRFKHK